MAVTAALLLCAATARPASMFARALDPSAPGVGQQPDDLLRGLTADPAPRFEDGVAGTLQDLVKFHGIPRPGLALGDLATTGSATLLPGDAAPSAAGSLYDLFDAQARSGGPAGFKVRVSEVEARVAAHAGAVPQPATWALMLTCAAIIGGIFRRRRAAALKRFAIGWR